jgi:nucleotide-binding universal stress UspA family protein
MGEEVRMAATGTEVEIEIDERLGVTIEEIVAYMKDKLIDLVIIGPHIRKGLLKVLQLSVTSKLVKEVTCPMLVLPSEA